MDRITSKKNVPSSLFSRITSFAGSIQMIFFSMLTCAQGGYNEMAVANFLWLHFTNNETSIQSFFFVFVEWVISGFGRHLEPTDTLGLMLVSIRCQPDKNKVSQAA